MKTLQRSELGSHEPGNVSASSRGKGREGLASLISNFRPPGQLENKCLLSSEPQSMVLCHGSHRKRIHTETKDLSFCNHHAQTVLLPTAC